MGDKLDLSGLRLRLTYNNGNKSPAFTADQLEQYGVKIALGNDGKVTPVSAEKIFTADDNGQTLFVLCDGCTSGNLWNCDSSFRNNPCGCAAINFGSKSSFVCRKKLRHSILIQE